MRNIPGRDEVGLGVIVCRIIRTGSLWAILNGWQVDIRRIGKGDFAALRLRWYVYELLLVLEILLMRGEVVLLGGGYLGAGEETHCEDEVGMS